MPCALPLAQVTTDQPTQTERNRGSYFPSIP